MTPTSIIRAPQPLPRPYKKSTPIRDMLIAALIGAAIGALYASVAMSTGAL
jgi:hypothetical protein